MDFFQAQERARRNTKWLVLLFILALLSIILALFTIVLLTVLSAYERKGHYLSVSKTKAKLVKQKITNPVANVLAHIYAYLLFIVYMTPVVMRLL